MQYEDFKNIKKEYPDLADYLEKSMIKSLIHCGYSVKEIKNFTGLPYYLIIQIYNDCIG